MRDTVDRRLREPHLKGSNPRARAVTHRDGASRGTDSVGPPVPSRAALIRLAL
jgi:hypothetical protein